MMTVVYLHVVKVGQQKKQLGKDLECPKQIEDDLKSMREDYLINDKSQMLVMLSMATDKIIL